MESLISNAFMKISVAAKPKSKNEQVLKIGKLNYKVSVKEETKEGKANKAVIESLSDYFKIPKSQICIVSGEKVKQKVIEITLSEKQLKEIEDSKILQPKLF